MSDRPTVLLVEPEQLLSDITAFRMELLGFSVHAVESAEAAKDFLADQVPDLMITDWQLPGESGLAFIERLMGEEEYCNLSIMVLSDDADLDHVQAVYNLGAKDFLVVPFHLEVLEEKVARLMEERAEQEEEANA